MDLTQLSTEDLQALQAGDLSKVSTQGLMALRGQPSQQGTGVSTAQSIPIAAGKKTDSILDGITQLYLGARGEKSALAGLKQNVDEKEALYAPLKAEHPIATGVGEALPSMAGGAGGLIRSLVSGAVPEMLSYGSAEERLKHGAVGALGGGAGWGVGRGVARVLQPAGQQVTRGLGRDARSAAERLGYKLSAGQQTQNPALQAMENYLARSPGSSGAAQVGAEANQATLNRAAAGAMGQQAGDLSEGVFSAAKQGIGNEFERLQQITAPDLGNDFLNSLAHIDSANAARGSFRVKAIDSLVDKGIDLAAKGKLTGTAYKEIRTAISNDANAAFKAGDATLGQALKTVRSSLDDAAKASLSKSDQEAWDVTRKQWQAYKLLTKGNVAEGGNVSAARVASAMRGQGDGLRTGAAQGPLSDVARLGESLKGVPNPTSGQLPQQMMYGNPVTGIPLVIGNKAMGAAYSSPLVQKYLKQGLLRIGPKGQILLGTGAKPAGLLGVQQYLGAE